MREMPNLSKMKRGGNFRRCYAGFNGVFNQIELLGFR